MAAFLAPLISEVTLVSPFPPDKFSLVWQWVNEYPDRNLDDFSPQTCEDFINVMNARVHTEQSWGVAKGSELCGIINYCPWSEHCGIFHGICFTERAWGRETTEKSVRLVLAQLFSEGVHKVSAMYFSDNIKIDRFLRDLGAVQEGYLVGQTMRNRQPVDMILVAIFKEAFNADRI